MQSCLPQTAGQAAPSGVLSAAASAAALSSGLQQALWRRSSGARGSGPREKTTPGGLVRNTRPTAVGNVDSVRRWIVARKYCVVAAEHQTSSSSGLQEAAAFPKLQLAPRKWQRLRPADRAGSLRHLQICRTLKILGFAGPGSPQR